MAPFRMLIRAGCAVAEGFRLSPRLEFDDIVRAAGRAIGRPDLRDPEAREAMEEILASIHGDLDFSCQGRVAIGSRLRDIVMQRAWLRDRESQGVLRRLDATGPPIVVTGFPRTGTTFSHRLLSLADDARFPTWCEALEPALDPRLDPRVAIRRRLRKYRGIRALSRVVSPELIAIHELLPDGPEECTQIHELAFDSESIALLGPTTSYKAWMDARDDAQLWERYRWQDLAFGSIVADRPESDRRGRWVLKAPQHQVQLDQLFRLFPDAKVIRMHRDPTKAMASVASLIECAASIMNRHVDLWRGDELLDLFTEWQRKGDEGMANHPGAVLEVRYDDLVANPMGFVERVHAFAGMPVEDGHRAAVTEYLAKRPQHHFGRHRYRLEQYGLTEDRVRKELGDYLDRMERIPRL